MQPMNALLERELHTLSEELRTKLGSHGFDEARLLRWAQRLSHAAPGTFPQTVTMPSVPAESDYLSLPAAGSVREEEARARGEQLLREGRVAMLVLAGGMATRMGGIVKALAEVPGVGTFLDARLAEMDALHKRFGKRPPLWLMSSDATDAALRAALEQRHAQNAHCFRQDLSLRLNPDGSLFRDDQGRPSSYATGHGDVSDALGRSGLLDAFVKAGGTHVFLTNVDNLGATLDPMLLGLSDLSTMPVTVEVCDKEPGDRGGIPVKVDGRMTVLEEFRLPPDFDPTAVRVFNTNTFWIRAEALAATHFEWPYFEVHKKVHGREAVQFERLVQELTAQFDTAYARVPRTGPESRFLPVKDNDDLHQRAQAIARALSARNLLPTKA